MNEASLRRTLYLHILGKQLQMLHLHQKIFTWVNAPSALERTRVRRKTDAIENKSQAHKKNCYVRENCLRIAYV